MTTVRYATEIVGWVALWSLVACWVIAAATVWERIT